MDVRVWYAGLDVDPHLAQELTSTVSQEERERAARFYFDRDRRRFLAARGILRSILGSALAVEPSRVSFRYGDREKPFLGHEFQQNLFFNVAHSHDHAMFAVADGAEVGVDIEAIRPLDSALEIAERFFSSTERAALRELPSAARLTAFFQCWTRKEAYVKAIGDGLARPLDSFDVPIGESAPRRLQGPEEHGPAASWSLHDVSDLPLYAAAVVIQGEPGVVRRDSWTGHRDRLR